MKTITKPALKEFHPIDNSLANSYLATEILHSNHISRKQFDDLIQIKRERAQLQTERRPLFFFIGLSLSLFMVILVFNWKTYDNTSMVELGDLDQTFNEILDVPLSVQPPPPPPKKLEVFTLKETANDIVLEEVELELDMEATEDLVVQEVVYDDYFQPEEIEEEKVEEIFLIVEDQASFPGGIGEFYSYVTSNITYPDPALRLRVSGRVFVKFVVEKDGSLSQVEVVKGIGAGCDEEAIRVIENSPDWVPARQRGRNVRQWMTVPINFTLRERN